MDMENERKIGAAVFEFSLTLQSLLSGALEAELRTSKIKMKMCTGDRRGGQQSRGTEDGREALNDDTKILTEPNTETFFIPRFFSNT